jgi:hypothetical protein
VTRISNAVVERWRRLSMHPVMRPFTEWRVFRRWVRDGRQIPAPPIVKQRILKQYQDRFGLRTVVETGTFTGETVEALRRRSREVVSIELAPDLHAQAVRRFASVANVRLLQGNSVELLPRVAEETSGPTLFWLDGHYAGAGTAGSGQSPLMHEVDALLARAPRGDVILIDDARDLTGVDGYPSLENLCATIRRHRPHADVTVRDDIVRWIDRGKKVKS